jgi:hypothetical protein
LKANRLRSTLRTGVDENNVSYIGTMTCTESIHHSDMLFQRSIMSSAVEKHVKLIGVRRRNNMVTYPNARFAFDQDLSSRLIEIRAGR